MRTLAPPSGWSQQGPQRSTEKVERPFWWEVLCLLKSHAIEMVGEVMVTLEDKNLKVCASCLVYEYRIAGIFRGYKCLRFSRIESVPRTFISY